VESTCSDPDARLARLVKCTTGPAHDAIQGTLVVGGAAGYARAKQMLAELLGADQIVVQQIVKGLSSTKPCKNADQVRAFSHKLLNARDVLRELNAIGEVDSQIVIKTIVQILPAFAQAKWSKKQLASWRGSSNYLKFCDFVDFVCSMAEDMCDPLYALNPAQMQSPAPKPPREKVFASSDSGGKPKGGRPKDKKEHNCSFVHTLR
jgi:hypothetical protein